MCRVLNINDLYRYLQFINDMLSVLSWQYWIWFQSWNIELEIMYYCTFTDWIPLNYTMIKTSKNVFIVLVLAAQFHVTYNFPYANSVFSFFSISVIGLCYPANIWWIIYVCTLWFATHKRHKICIFKNMNKGKAHFY